MGVFLRKGLTALQYLEQGQANKKRCDRKKAELSEEEKMLIQEDLEKNWSLEVIKARFSDTISCSIPTLYCLGDGGVFSQKRVSLVGKKKDQWAHGNWSLDVIKARFSATISCSMRTLYCLGDGDVFSKEEFP